MDDRVRVAELLGREPRGSFEVVVRDVEGDPVVIRNAPLLDDGTPMPTRYYLVGADLVRAVSRLEAAGGVQRAETEVDADAIARAHARYAAERDAGLPIGHDGPRPSGGVGGTRIGVKCLHAHVAHSLAGGDDPVGAWALSQLAADVSPDGATTSGDRPHDGATEPTERTAQDPTTPDDRPTDGEAVNPDPGGMTLHLHDRRTDLVRTGGGQWSLDVGPRSLFDDELERAARPAPELLTNALGAVSDRFEDVAIADRSILATPSLALRGEHAVVLARVEIGLDEVPAGYRLRRVDAEEVFRTLVAEHRDDRRDNPGLPEAHVDTVIGTCCVVLAVMRRLDLPDAGVVVEGAS